MGRSGPFHETSLLFQCHRSNVLPIGDLAVRNGTASLWNVKGQAKGGMLCAKGDADKIKKIVASCCIMLTYPDFTKPFDSFADGSKLQLVMSLFKAFPIMKRLSLFTLKRLKKVLSRQV